MIITLSPAKLMDFESSIPSQKHTNPLYEKEANTLYDSLKNASVSEIGKLMSINPQIAQDVYGYIHAFHLDRTPKRQTIFAYNGIAYKGLDAHSLNEKDLDFAQKHLVHLSGLYGVLRPLDLIKPYRLEMKIALVNDRGKNLYDFWTETISKYMAKQMEADDNIWVNLTSKGYAKAVNRKLLPNEHRIITPIFKQDTAKGAKQIGVYAKKARGMMTRFIIKNQLKKVEDLKAFDIEGYSFSTKLSKGDEWIFIR